MHRPNFINRVKSFFRKATPPPVTTDHQHSVPQPPVTKRVRTKGTRGRPGFWITKDGKRSSKTAKFVKNHC